MSKAPMSICDGDIVLGTLRGRTILQYLPPVGDNEDNSINHPGRYPEWSEEEWARFIERSRKLALHCPELPGELLKIKTNVREQRMHGELHIENVDSGRVPNVSLIHSLELRFSHRQNYIRISGSGTFKRMREIKALGMEWDPESRSWHCSFSLKMLGRARGLVRVFDERRDPVEAGLVKCATCHEWAPEDTPCCSGRSKGGVLS